MGLLQRAIETYDANTALIGVYRDGHEPLAPIGHILTSANIEITLNAQGKFLAARKVDKKEPKILIPVTEESSGRTSGLAAHPLCDQLKYVANTNKEAHELYLTALRKWERSAYAHPFLTAISTYVRNGSILKDLTKCGVLALEKGGGYDEKQMICWRVLGIPTEEPACWKNRNLFSAFESYYCSQLATRDMALCMLEGKTEPIALQHPKGHHPGEWECKADLGQ
ncbi:MAG: type I-C CRISPR-associated protein Cas8c/Csd1 [Oscillospiraceae bacterium]